jgi:hypothetical protein
MAKSFAELKKSRNKSFEELAQKAKSIADNKGQGGSDDRLWSPTVDKSGNGYAVIRFLPEPQGENFPYVSYYDHGFQGPTGLWYIEKSLTSIGKDDPLSEYNSKLWNTGLEANKEIVRKQKRRLHYVSNIYVVSDPSNPDNEGKVFLYIYGKKIFDKLNEAMNPQFEDETPVNPFDFWEGVNFKLKIRKVEGYRNYDKSEFDSPEPLFENDSDLEKVYESLHSLQEFIEPSNYKSYEELKEKMERVLCLTDNDVTPQEPKSFRESSPARNEIKEMAKPEPKISTDTDDDLDDDYFRKLIE